VVQDIAIFTGVFYCSCLNQFQKLSEINLTVIVLMEA